MDVHDPIGARIPILLYWHSSGKPGTKIEVTGPAQ